MKYDTGFGLLGAACRGCTMRAVSGIALMGVQHSLENALCARSILIEASCPHAPIELF